MAITVLGMDSFQWLTNPAFLAPNRWNAAPGVSAIGSPGPYGTGSYARGGALDTFAFPVAGLVMTEFSIRFAAFGAEDIVQFRVDTVDNAASLQVNAGGQLVIAITGNPPVVLPANLSLNTWYRIQINLKFGLGGTGRVVIKRNGTIIGNIPGTYDFAGNVTPVSFIRYRCGALANTDFSNIIWGTIGDPVADFFPADQRATILRALADSSVAFTPTGAATNADCINDVDPDGDTTYNASTAPGDQDLFSVTPPGLTGTVNLVGVTAIARKIDASPDFVSPSVNTSATIVQGPSFGLGANYQGTTAPWIINPVTAVAWTPADIDAIEFGYFNAS